MDAKELIAALDAAENVVSADRAAALDDSLINTLDQAVKAARAAIPSDAAQAPFVVTEIAAAEWAARHDIECNLKSFSTQRSAIEDARTMHLIDAAPVAPAAAAPINLEGLRKKLLTPRKILRDEDGYLTHPDFPLCDEGTHAGKFLDAFGIDAKFVAMESDDPASADRYFEAGEAHCSYWTPTPPEGDGWLLLEIYDTEDGPCALFGRDRYEAENALKRERMRAQLDRIQQRQATQGDTQP